MKLPGPRAVVRRARRLLHGPPPRERFERVHLDEAARAAILAGAANPLEAVYYAHAGRGAYKWRHYLEPYDRHLGRFRGQLVRVLEIGIHQGGSLQVWKAYFGERAIIHGIDIDPRCAGIAEDRIVPHVGDQADAGLLRRVVEEMGGVDVVIDDAAHRSGPQIASFETLYPLLSPHGVYVCEDTRASYWREFGGGCRKPGTFVEYAKGLVDSLHAWYLERNAPVSRDETFARMTLGIFFYDSMIVLEKRPRDLPVQHVVGRPGW